MAGRRSDTPSPPMIAQKMMMAADALAERHRQRPDRVGQEPEDVRPLAPMRSPTLLPIRMKAAETSASRAIADWMLLTLVPRSATTAEIETFMIDVSTTRTNVAIASRMGSRLSAAAASGALGLAACVTAERRCRRHPSFALVRSLAAQAVAVALEGKRTGRSGGAGAVGETRRVSCRRRATRRR